MFKALVATVALLTTAAQAALVSTTSSATLNTGWSVTIDVTYDDAVPNPSASSLGPTNGIETLDVSFFDPMGNLAYAINNVTAGESSSFFLDLTLDSAAGTPLPGSSIEVGGFDGDDYFRLGGDVGGFADIFRLGVMFIDTTSALRFVVKTPPDLVELCYELLLDGGYRVEGTLIYDVNLPVVFATGVGPAQGIDTLEVNIFDPSGTLLYSVESVSNGFAAYQFVFVQFDTALQNLVPGSFFDIGQDTQTPGEYYLLGDEGAPASLTLIDANFAFQTADSTTNATFTFTDKTPPCNPADIATPFGVLDLADIDTFIIGFTSTDPIADIAPPTGILDLTDVDTFITSFLAGCP